VQYPGLEVGGERRDDVLGLRVPVVVMGANGGGGGGGERCGENGDREMGEGEMGSGWSAEGARGVAGAAVSERWPLVTATMGEEDGASWSPANPAPPRTCNPVGIMRLGGAEARKDLPTGASDVR